MVTDDGGVGHESVWVVILADSVEIAIAAVQSADSAVLARPSGIFETTPVVLRSVALMQASI